jgi:hypothetical protein
MSIAKVEADLILGVGEFLSLNTEVSVEDLVTLITSIPAGGNIIRQVSASNILLHPDEAVNTDLLGGNPQTNVRLLILLAE